MTRKFDIERLEGRGITAVVIGYGKLYTTFPDFANAADCPDAVRPKKVDINGYAVEVLAKGKHDSLNKTLYVIKDYRGARYIIEESGLKITERDEVKSSGASEIINAYERGYAKGKADAMAEMRRVIGE